MLIINDKPALSKRSSFLSAASKSPVSVASPVVPLDDRGRQRERPERYASRPRRMSAGDTLAPPRNRKFHVRTVLAPLSNPFPNPVLSAKTKIRAKQLSKVIMTRPPSTADDDDDESNGAANGVFVPTDTFVFTPADEPPAYTPRDPSSYAPSSSSSTSTIVAASTSLNSSATSVTSQSRATVAKKSNSSPLLPSPTLQHHSSHWPRHHAPYPSPSANQLQSFTHQAGRETRYPDPGLPHSHSHSTFSRSFQAVSNRSDTDRDDIEETETGDDDENDDGMIYTSLGRSSSRYYGSPSSSSEGGSGVGGRTYATGSSWGRWKSSSSNNNGNANLHGQPGLRERIFGSVSLRAWRRTERSVKDRPKTICTTPGAVCAGETETEIDEPPRHLPTSRIVPSSGALVPPSTLQQRLTPLLFEFSRLLAIVPAFIGTIYNLYHLWRLPTEPMDGRSPPQRVDYAVSALWAILTGWQCLCLTTGLLMRWKIYYPPLSTLIRLLALQGICWRATQMTCRILEHDKRPVITWAVIATTTCVSRGIQIWVTSNLWWEVREASVVKPVNGSVPGVAGADSTANGGTASGSSTSGFGGTVNGAGAMNTHKEDKLGYWKRWRGGRWGGRRWDWKEVGRKCVLPAGIVYFIMAWAEVLRREFEVAEAAATVVAVA